MRRFRIALVCLAAAMLAGCVASSTASYVTTGLSEADAQTLAADVATHLRSALPAARSTLALQPTGATDAFTPVLAEKLRAAGYGVAASAEATHGGDGAQPAAGQTREIVLRYLVSPFDAGVVLRLQYQGVEASRFYSRTAGGALGAGSPFTVRSAS